MSDASEEDIVMLVAAAQRGREMLRGIRFDFEPSLPLLPTAGDHIAGSSLGHLQGARGLHFCRCGKVEVPGRRDLCPDCLAADRDYQNRRLLLDAYQSISPDGAYDWCRPGTAEYRIAVERALPFCAAMSEPLRKAAIRIGHGHYARADGHLLLIGPTGIGKTSIARAGAMRVLDLGAAGKLDRVTMRFASGIRLVSALELARCREETRLGSKPELVREAERATLLILDEIGFEKKGTDPTIVRDVVFERVAKGRPVIATSGKTRAHLESTTTGYGQAFIRRLEELGMVIDMHGGKR